MGCDQGVVGGFVVRDSRFCPFLILLSSQPFIPFSMTPTFLAPIFSGKSKGYDYI